MASLHATAEDLLRFALSQARRHVRACEVDDLAQQALLELFVYGSRHSIGAPFALLRDILNKRAKNAHRARRSNLRFRELRQDTASEPGITAPPPPPDPSGEAADARLAGMGFGRLQRTIIEHVLAGQSIRRAAEALSIPDKEARRIVKQILARMAKREKASG